MTPHYHTLLAAGYGELERYQLQVQRHPMLSAEEEFELAVRFREAGDLDAAHRLVTAHLRYVVSIAREYVSYGLRLMDLVQEGSVGLMQAVKRFDPHRGFRLSTYAGWWIRAAIQEFVLRSWSLVKIGTTTAQRKLFFNLRKSKQTIDRLDASQAADIGRKLGVKTEAVLEMDGRLSGRDDTLNRPTTEFGEEWQNFLADTRDNQEEVLLQDEQHHLRQTAVSRALAILDPRERSIIAQRIMSDSPVTLEVLGEGLKVSRERVRQLEKRALGKLRKALNDHPF